MIDIEPIPLKEDPLECLLRYLRQDRSRPFESAAVMPTSRSIRRLIHLMSKDSPVPVALPYCFEMKDFTLRCLDSEGYGLVPEELRLLYLRKAVRGLDEGKLSSLFGREHARYYEDFLRFASVGRRLLRFYDEVFAEGVGFEDLVRNSLYTDYERDVLVLEEIVSAYRRTLNEEGLTDLIFLKGDFLSSPAETPRFYDPAFLKRFRRVCVLSAGRLSRFELKLIEKASEVVDVKVFLHYEGAADGNTVKISSILDSDVTLPEIPPAPYPAFIEVEEFSLPEEQAGFVMNSIRKSVDMGIGPEEIVVVLPDDGLKRVLYAFDRDGILNFAMGLDMRDTVFYSFLAALEKMLASRGSDGAYETRAVMNFLGHPFVKGLAGEGYEPFVSDVKRRNRLFVLPEDLCATGELADACRGIEGLFSRSMGFSEFCSRVRGLVEWMMGKNAQLIERLRGSPEFAGAEKAFFESLIMLGMLPYGPVQPGGEPLGHLAYLNEYLKGLTYPHTWGGPVTVMGMLETRALGFRAVIIPDMNEEFMPPASEKEMFLNTEIRRRVGLPTFLDREALSRTYFNALLKKAGAVFLSYACSEGRRPRSRFIEEIEMQKGCSLLRGPDLQVDSMRKTLQPVSVQAKSYVPAKDEHVLRVIESMELTPTSLRTYRECRFRFYLKYIKRLREKEDLSEELQRVDIGNIFHSAIRKLYGRLFGTSMRRRKEAAGGRGQAGLFPSPPPWTKLADELRSGVLEEAEQYDIFRKSPHARLELDVFIDKLKVFADSERALFEEGWQPSYLEFPVSMRLKGMRFRGKIDRVDVMPQGGAGSGAPLRCVIIDYKLSDVNAKERTVLDEDFKDFQLPLYRLMLGETVRGVVVEALAYYDLKRSFRLKKVFGDLTDEEFRRYVEGIVTELRDGSQGFERTGKEQNCKYCSYRDICR
ncbi:MAG: hypothetical protein GXO94_04530 [Nitrospirae bacterium]|nr:hypothetical protein [Nitrospirota bacterium]